ncbi:hypothetical protein KAFR_0H00560 [Kazachstania africana CBS 2517]|uniref:RING-type E3 ubiquitin transferase n=1 Tax=Kazachstania africana (strain ATCC 22294 / BCRC 22015 / CBS 2517 / CECT 1963 / NBRC 1671 / NRRL Y-8276) TaxID=1071382 RepID=H2AYQ9_KAZAF|nr:hypothetical protein KAFR_0H00560 [Kazachstania africana CBS 2517]CCF59465.1 hypothetical protein KAFR_0H00560 [Kazachstania africana CBS 2517]
MPEEQGLKNQIANTSNRDDLNDRRLPFADAASIIQSHQKDDQIVNLLIEKLNNFLKLVKGQLFINLYPREITLFAKMLYLFLTTIKKTRTLGEEYADIFIVNRPGTGLAKRYQRLLFILSYCLSPYLFTKLINRWNSKNDETDENGILSSFEDLFNVVLDIHLMLFYFKGAYYDIFRRIFGLRYAFGHKITATEKIFRDKNSSTYKVLGYILLLQNSSKLINVLKDKLDFRKLSIDTSRGEKDMKAIFGVPKQVKTNKIDLNDDTLFTFIQGASRTCILCLSKIVDPSCAPCGHLYCWDCILNWCNEKPECPLCRQKCHPQQILPIK